MKTTRSRGLTVEEAPVGVTAETTVEQVLTRYPESIEVFFAHGFTELRNPVLRRTLPRVTSIRRACALRGVDLRAFLRELNEFVITEETTVNEVLSLNRRALAVLARFGIDACCGGGATLGQAARKKGLDPAAVVEALKGVLDGAAPAPAPTGGPVTPVMMISDVIARWPATVEVFRRNGLLECGVPGGPREPVAFFARAHRVGLPGLLEELNRVAEGGGS